MSKVRAVNAPALRRPKLYPAVLMYAVLVAGVTTYLLFKSDIIIETIVTSAVGGGRYGVAAALSVAASGVFALPYLLRMRVSPLMRAVGLVSSFVAPCGWLLTAWWLELYVGDGRAAIALIGAYCSLLLAFVSVWCIGIPVQPLKKRH